MNVKELAEGLHPLERKTFPKIPSKSSVMFSELAKQIPELQEVEIMRAIQWLENKGVVKTVKEEKKVAELTELGNKYLKTKLPERRFYNALLDKKEHSFEELKKEAHLDDSEFQAVLGIIRQKHIPVSISKERKIKLAVALPEFEKPSVEENFLLEAAGNPEKIDLNDELFKTLIRRGIAKVKDEKSVKISITSLGLELKKVALSEDVIDKLTTKIIKEGSWKGKNFRRFDVKINVPATYASKKQTYRRFLDDVRQKLIGLGFEEFAGPVVESEFWNMDALFMPQFHSARDIHDAYYIKEPKYAKLDEKIVERVKKAHETGFGTGSKGWKYDFDVKRTHQLVLRSQGTACSSRMLASKDLKIPGKYFGIARCFRYDVIDAKHLPGFIQTEGIIVDYNLNLKHLFGVLKMFAKEVAGADKIKITPGYFPFTEPSCELSAKHPELGWIELGGAGIFRPELVKPLVGKDVSVIAWGLGVDRLGMFKLGIKDIRHLFSHDLQYLRESRVI